MSDQFTLTATARDDIGKGASRRLRREQNLIPAIVYGAGKDPASLSLQENELQKALSQEAFYSQIITLNIAGKKEQVVLKDLQRHPYKPRVLHVDLQRVSATQKLDRQVPLHLIGADDAPGVKESGGVISHLMTEVEVRCLPADLPAFIEVDISNLELDRTLHLSDLTAPKGVEFVSLQLEEPHDLPVVAIHEPKEVPVEEEAPAEAEGAEEGEAAEGETPAEGGDETEGEGSKEESGE